MTESVALINGAGMRHPEECPMAPDIERLITSIQLMAEKVDNLIKFQRDVTKWLLVVVCVIALGRSALDLGKSMLTDFHTPAKAHEVVSE